MALRRRREEDVAQSAFWMETFEQHGSAVMAFLASRTGRRDVAEDLLQETFVRAMRAQPQATDVGGIRSYLFTTAHHLLVSRYRKRSPILFSEVAEPASRTFEEISDPRAESPESAADLSRLELPVEPRGNEDLVPFAVAHDSCSSRGPSTSPSAAMIFLRARWTLLLTRPSVQPSSRAISGYGRSPSTACSNAVR